MIKNKKEIEKKLASLIITTLLTITAFLSLPIVRAPFVPSGDITPAVWEMTTNKWVSGQPSGYKEGDTAAMGTFMTVGAGEWIVNVTLQVYESPFTDAYGFTDFEPWDLTVTPPFLFEGNRQDAGIDVDGTYGTGWDISHDFIWFYNATVVEVLPDPYTPTLGYAGGNPNYIGISVTFTKSHDGPCWMLYGGHLASFGDPLPAGSPESNINGVVDLNEGAHFMTGVFQSRIEGAGDKTINFKGGNLIDIDYKPLIQVIKDGPATAGIGEEITYYFNVSHAPGSDCSPVAMTSVIDNVSGNAVYISGDSNDSGKLDCGETWWYYSNYTILASDPNPLKNIVNASGTDEDGELVYDNDTHELTIEDYPPIITTLLSDETITLGDSITDTVTFTGLPSITPTEPITFQHQAPGESTWTTYDSQTLTPAGPGTWTATSIAFTPNEVGTWYFRATYPGDDNYCSNASGDTAEVLDVGCYTPTITTLLSQTTILLGESLTDTVTFTGLAGYTPTETIIFQHQAPGESTWTTYDSQGLAPAGSGIWTATSIAFTPNEVGTWYFRATYPGDDNYCSNASGDTAEVLDVGCYTPSITTLLSETTITLGDSLTDTVTFTGLADYTPTQPITFQHQAPGEITWTTYDTQTLTPAEPGTWTATSIAFTPNQVGTWYFRATYPGDDNYCPNASGDTAEVLAVGCYPPLITTLLSDDTIAYEESVTDTVTFIGLEGYTPTNTIVFQHKAPGESTWTTFDSQTLIADGPGVWTATSISFTLDEVGTWYFRAFYYGDDNYSSNHSADESEPLAVSAQPGIHIDKTADKLIIYPGEDITYYFWVNNSGNVRIQITSLEDDVLGDILTNPEVQLTGDNDNDGWLDTTEHWIYSFTQHWNQTTTMFTLSLPTIPVIINVVNGTVSYYDLTLSGVPDGYDVINGYYISWCIQRDTIMPRNINHTVTLYSSYDPNLPDIVKDYEWHQINYILNHKNGYDKTAIQEAIWYLTDQKSTTNPDALALLQEASEFGTDFEPHVGQIIAVIVIGSPLIQRVIFEVTLPNYPITNNVSIEAVDPFGTPVSSNDSLTVMVEGE